MSGHTKGPWIVVSNEESKFDYDKLHITTEDRIYRSLVPIAEVGVDYNEPLESEQQANAILLAAAPDMLAALKSAQAALSDGGFQGLLVDAALRAIDVAIARAEGRQP